MGFNSEDQSAAGLGREVQRVAARRGRPDGGVE